MLPKDYEEDDQAEDISKTSVRIKEEAKSAH